MSESLSDPAPPASLPYPRPARDQQVIRILATPGVASVALVFVLLGAVAALLQDALAIEAGARGAVPVSLADAAASIWRVRVMAGAAMAAVFAFAMLAVHAVTALRQALEDTFIRGLEMARETPTDADVAALLVVAATPKVTLPVPHSGPGSPRLGRAAARRARARRARRPQTAARHA